MKKIHVALVGLSFGAAFAAIYKAHPDVRALTLFDINRDRALEVAKSIGGAQIAGSFEEILSNRDIDAVHLVTPIPMHGDMSVRVLNAGKHCACTVPMAISLEDIDRITRARRSSGKNYMMMETTLYTYQYHYVKGMKERGELGRIQFFRGSHYQDMTAWPDYWMGLPPMWYGTHAIAPMVGLSDSRICEVHCYGSGSMDPELVKRYHNPYPVESALFRFESGIKGEATRSLFETARIYQEGMFVYGSKATFEWGFGDGDAPYVTTFTVDVPREGRRERDEKVEVVPMPNFYQDLPEELWRFTVGGNFDPQNPHKSLEMGGGAGHHGSHPHLVHEFVRSCVEERRPWIDEVLGGNITAAGLCAHESALREGERVTVPTF